MFGKKNKKTELNFKTDNYVIPEFIDTSNLVVGNLESVTNETELPTIITTNQKFIFEKIDDNGKTRYKEIFTGFVADIEGSCMYFNYPYIVNIIPIKEVLPTIMEKIPKYSLLLALNEVNTKSKIVKNQEIANTKKKCKKK